MNIFAALRDVVLHRRFDRRLRDHLRELDDRTERDDVQQAWTTELAIRQSVRRDAGR